MPIGHHRRSIRLKDRRYDEYGMYFVTICSAQRKTLFGEIVESNMLVGNFGVIVEEEWLRSAEMRLGVDMDAFVVMPDHFHGIVVFSKEMVEGESRARGANGGIDASQGVIDGAHGMANEEHGVINGAHAVRPYRLLGREKQTVGSLIAGFKSSVTSRIRQLVGEPDLDVWQRNY